MACRSRLHFSIPGSRRLPWTGERRDPENIQKGGELSLSAFRQSPDGWPQLLILRFWAPFVNACRLLPVVWRRPETEGFSF